MSVGLSIGLAYSQTSPQEHAEAKVVMTKLSPPVYPPLARAAHIAGSVRLELLVRKDGTVESAKLISGHPILVVAAMESARKSSYECPECGGQKTSYSLTYTFGLRDDGPKQTIQEQRVHSLKCLCLWKCGLKQVSTWSCHQNPPEVTQSPGHVVILASQLCVEPMASAR